MREIINILKFRKLSLIKFKSKKGGSYYIIIYIYLHFVLFSMQKDPSTFTNTTMKQKSQKISANLKICPFMTLRPLPKCLSMSTCVIHSTPLHFTPLRHTSMLDKRALKTYIYIYMYNKSSQQQQRHLSVITPICFSFRVRKPPSYFSGMFWCIILRQIKFSN